MAANLEQFHIFSDLPIDIRLMIWEVTFPRRLISFSLSTYDAARAEDTTARNVNPTFAVASSDPRGLFAVQSQVVGPGGKMINNGLPLPTLICTEKLGRILALSVSRESRDFAMRVGYRPWTLRVSYGTRTRRIMWNPVYDVVFLDEKHSQSLKGQPLFILTEKFKNSYPSQVRELRSLAVYTSHWNQKDPNQEVMVEKWVEFSSLKKIVAVLDSEYETARAETIPVADGSTSLWMNQDTPDGHEDKSGSTTKKLKGVLFPGDLEKDLARGKMAQEKWSNWIVPTVTLCDRDRLVQGITDNLELRLRCYPCDSLSCYIQREQDDRLLGSWRS